MSPAIFDRDDYSQFFQLSQDLLTVVQRGGIVLRASDAWQSVLGYDPGQVAGKNVFSLVHPDDLEMAISAARVVEGGMQTARIEARMRTRSGDYRWMDWSVSPSPAGELMYCITRDITDLRRKRDGEEMLIEALQETTMALHNTANELDIIRAEAEYLATHDALTGLLSRRAWVADVGSHVPGSLALLDVDNFKRVNDAYGHPVGDAVLAGLANRLTEAIDGSSCRIGRLGGEEFGIAFEGSAEQSYALLRGALNVIARTSLHTAAGPLTMTMSAGITAWPDGEADAFARAYDTADRALYRAKHAGRNRAFLASYHQAAA
jgi:diguanylate cyclase (GGDEF)-like protein/PAS domain S-box-containing protein